MFKNKKRMYPITVDREIFPKFKRIQLAVADLKIKGLEQITQTHRDILDAIALVGKRIPYHGDKKRLAFRFFVSDALRELGHNELHNHAWLVNKLKELARTTLEIEVKLPTRRGIIISTILQKVAYWEERKDENLEPGECLAVCSEEFTVLLLEDYLLYAKPEVIRAILNLDHEFLKLAVRYILTQEKVFKKVGTLIKEICPDADRRLTWKYKQLLETHADFLNQHFGIKLKQTPSDLLIEYKKDPKLIAIDYNLIPT
ncbi:MAG: hypothetical protein QXD54_05460 [Candidatus Aenigmatarchaeota archaeon]